MKIREFLDEARGDQLREGRGSVRLIGLHAPGRGLLVPWPPLTEKEWEESHDEPSPAHLSGPSPRA